MKFFKHFWKSNDFYTVIIEDCTVSADQETHEAFLEIYRRSPLYPIFRIMGGQEFLEELDRQ